MQLDVVVSPPAFSLTVPVADMMGVADWAPLNSSRYELFNLY